MIINVCDNMKGDSTSTYKKWTESHNWYRSDDAFPSTFPADWKFTYWKPTDNDITVFVTRGIYDVDNIESKTKIALPSDLRDFHGPIYDFIEENIDIIRQALPQAAVLEGAPVSEGLIGTATGVPNNLLKDPNLYTRKERTTKKAGLVPYEKNKGIDNSSILKAIGIIEGKRTAGPRDKQAQTAKGLINVLAKFATNQEVRQQKDLTPQQKTDIETGKGSRLLYSLNTKGNGKWVQNPLNNKRSFTFSES